MCGSVGLDAVFFLSSCGLTLGARPLCAFLRLGPDLASEGRVLERDQGCEVVGQRYAGFQPLDLAQEEVECHLDLVGVGALAGELLDESVESIAVEFGHFLPLSG